MIMQHKFILCFKILHWQRKLAIFKSRNIKLLKGLTFGKVNASEYGQLCCFTYSLWGSLFCLLRNLHTFENFYGTILHIMLSRGNINTYLFTVGFFLNFKQQFLISSLIFHNLKMKSTNWRHFPTVGLMLQIEIMTPAYTYDIALPLRVSSNVKLYKCMQFLFKHLT